MAFNDQQLRQMINNSRAVAELREHFRPLGIVLFSTNWLVLHCLWKEGVPAWELFPELDREMSDSELRFHMDDQYDKEWDALVKSHAPEAGSAEAAADILRQLEFEQPNVQGTHPFNDSRWHCCAPTNPNGDRWGRPCRWGVAAPGDRCRLHRNTQF
eukprot:comp24308_c1_seq1/m.45679 comp24308_c1_seq1/g.45679  ORF comp24308_c1_seq1/g.45679 comp24308_c1_seq1/m.45679 type:complete len:157 (-) comp24308_c1_seq1:125-595(-)